MTRVWGHGERVMEDGLKHSWESDYEESYIV